ncbi:MAG TPA: hypothetical protein VFA12_07640 [Stellaceae bacterium]|nr:hypothetical protein [Stellaceae bacterium]
MSTLGLFVLVLNFAISWANARTSGLVWVESKHIGGWIRFMTWMGWLMSALGFTWCYVIVLALFARSGGYIDDRGFDAALSLGYLIVIPGVLFSGLFIWIDSLVVAWRQRDLPSMGVAAWNTFAQAYNTYSAIEGVGGAAKSVGSLFSDVDADDIKGVAVIAVILIVLAAIAGGFITTELIRRHYAASRPLPAHPAAAPA